MAMLARVGTTRCFPVFSPNLDSTRRMATITSLSTLNCFSTCFNDLRFWWRKFLARRIGFRAQKLSVPLLLFF